MEEHKIISMTNAIVRQIARECFGSYFPSSHFSNSRDARAVNVSLSNLILSFSLWSPVKLTQGGTVESGFR